MEMSNNVDNNNGVDGEINGSGRRMDGRHVEVDTECDNDNLDERRFSDNDDDDNNSNINTVTLARRFNDGNDAGNNTGGDNGIRIGNNNVIAAHLRGINHGGGNSRPHKDTSCDRARAAFCDSMGGKMYRHRSVGSLVVTGTAATTAMSVSTSSNSSLSSLGLAAPSSNNDNYRHGGFSLNLNLNLTAPDTSGSVSNNDNDNNNDRHRRRWNRILRNRWAIRRGARNPAPPPTQDLFLAQIRLLSTITEGPYLYYYFQYSIYLHSRHLWRPYSLPQ